MTILASTLLLASHLFLTQGCTCAPNSLKQEYFMNANARVIRVKVNKEIEECVLCDPGDTSRTRLTLVRVVGTFKGCPVPIHTFVRSAVSEELCGVRLEIGEEYLLMLSGDFISELSSCQFIKLWSAVTQAEKSFLKIRQLCCFGHCECGLDKPSVKCAVAPCRIAEPPCDEAATCVDNFCGGYFAEWFKRDGYPACEGINDTIRAL